MFLRSKQKNLRGSRGATLMEIALALPVFLALVMFLVWVPLAFNSHSALTHAVVEGARLAITRSDWQLMGADESSEGSIAALQEIDSNDSWLGILATPDLEGQATITYNSWTNSVFSGTDFKDLPSSYIYATAYAVQYMRSSLGGSVRFPCDPNGSGPKDGSGCLKCHFVRPDASSRAHIESDTTYTTYPGGAPPTDHFLMRCIYQPDHVLYRTIGRLLGITGANPFVLEQMVFYNLQEL